MALVETPAQVYMHRRKYAYLNAIQWTTYRCVPCLLDLSVMSLSLDEE